MTRRLAALVLATALAGCGAEPSASPSPSAVTPEPGTTCGAGADFTEVPELVGLPEDDVRQSARRLGYTWRLAGRDGKCATVTDDFQPRRVNTYAEDGVIVWAKLY